MKMIVGCRVLIFICTIARVQAAVNLTAKYIEDILDSIKGGVLVKNGKLTSCELAITNIGRGIVNSDCIDFGADGLMDPDVSYGVFIDRGVDGVAGHYEITRLTTMANFHTGTLLNNYVDVAIDWNNTVSWNAVMASVVNYEWDAVLYVRRVLLDTKRMIWGVPQYALGSTSHDEECEQLSNVFKSNQDYLICSNLTARAPSRDLAECSIPYGTVYGLRYNMAFLMGLHSYSATAEPTGEPCGYGKQRNYYTSLYKYINNGINRGESYYTEFQMFGLNASSLDRSYLMSKPKDATEQQGVQLARGDLYRNQRADVVMSPDVVSAAATLNGISNLDELLRYDSAHTGELSNRVGVIIGVCVAIGGVLLMIGGFMWWWLRRKRSPNVADPVGRNNFQDMLETELHGPAVPQHIPASRYMFDDLPPVYDDEPTHVLPEPQPAHVGHVVENIDNEKKVPPAQAARAR